MNQYVYDKNHYHWQIPLLVGVCIILIGIYGNFCNFFNFNLSDFVLIITLVAILWYSFETRELKIATQKQLEPILFLYLDKSVKYLELSNVGKTPIANLFIRPVLIGNNKFEFNILKPISHILPGEKHEIEFTKSNNSRRTFNQTVRNLISAMQTVDIKKIELMMIYDTNFQTNEEVKFVFEIPGRLPDEKDPIRECKIYFLPK